MFPPCMCTKVFKHLKLYSKIWVGDKISCENILMSLQDLQDPRDL